MLSSKYAWYSKGTGNIYVPQKTEGLLSSSQSQTGKKQNLLKWIAYFRCYPAFKWKNHPRNSRIYVPDFMFILKSPKWKGNASLYCILILKNIILGSVTRSVSQQASQVTLGRVSMVDALVGEKVASSQLRGHSNWEWQDLFMFSATCHREQSHKTTWMAVQTLQELSAPLKGHTHHSSDLPGQHLWIILAERNPKCWWSDNHRAGKSCTGHQVHIVQFYPRTLQFLVWLYKIHTKARHDGPLLYS